MANWMVTCLTAWWRHVTLLPALIGSLAEVAPYKRFSSYFFGFHNCVANKIFSVAFLSYHQRHWALRLSVPIPADPTSIAEFREFGDEINSDQFSKRPPTRHYVNQYSNDTMWTWLRPAIGLISWRLVYLLFHTHVFAAVFRKKIILTTNYLLSFLLLVVVLVFIAVISNTIQCSYT